MRRGLRNQGIDRRLESAYDHAFARGRIGRGERAEMMDEKKIEHFRKLLEERRAQLYESMHRSEEEGREAQTADSAQDIADRASSAYQKELLFTRSTNERQFLRMVEHALSHIADGSYGECDICGEDINERRLEAVPWARHCIACQEKLERGEVQQPA